ncbi:MAG: aspartyl/glutamyl-tRNA(Asn/Gln) amidotransferase subunit [Nitrospirae bacterium]|jgi:aspartyl-tRNA(Asn)/glutamyl-tRNA(Gln) amidotransferase subunit C|nr:aspartyl/glutamyl-tRNA(Asn/Gln) amidotransferase subunit [Nitrospirota bacterium]MBS1126184.1 aspartyl/glutamyl-tRNA(Asn/Gln) amidotransferase subunit [Nitrospirota bacterium]
MKISIEHLGRLARLSVSDDEKILFAKQIDNILHYMDKLNELDTGNIEPTSHVISLSNVVREDLREHSLDREDALRNAPDKTNKFFRVPKIIE